MMEEQNSFKVSMEEEIHRNPELKAEDIKHVQEWLQGQAHLPKMCGECLMVYS